MMKKQLVKLTGVLAGLLVFASCGYATTADHKDPYETYNRSAYRFNQTIDQIALKPAAKVYDRILPGPIKKGVLNFFDNLNELPTIANDLLQGNLVYAASNSWRFLINSTVGVFGVIDVASRLGVAKYSTDFGITLRKWGIKPTPYLVLPLLGPSTVTDTFAIPVDYQATVYNYVKPKSIVYGAVAVNTIGRRAELLKYGSADDVTLDPYIFQRHAYLQQREALLQKAKGRTSNDLEAGYDFGD